MKDINLIHATDVGAVYRYDAVGSFERIRAVCAGKGERLIQPMLDELSLMDADDSLWVDMSVDPQALASTGSMIASPTHPNVIYLKDLDRTDKVIFGINHPPSTTSDLSTIKRPKYCIDLNVEEACQLVRNVFTSAAEREISVGDGLDVWIVHRDPSDSRTTDTTLQSHLSNPGGPDNQLHTESEDDSNGVGVTAMDRLISASLSRSHSEHGSTRVLVSKRHYSLPKH